ncbi:hypothetical protein [Ferrimicrobium sp.]|uniref:SCO6745 family protein n=1 Tax=Ferrimicrobium sp. TaxID=2926050 RepID=UPI0026276747|nr:hypothetical protein [Ferrimicrobium sp.]
MDRNERYASSLKVWAQLETFHDLTYFAKECRESYKTLGVADSWARYFGGRAAPMGQVEPGVVTAAFYSFSHHNVEAAIPSVWKIAAPEQFITARFAGILATWDRIMGSSTLAPSVEVLARATQIATKISRHGERDGHPLYAANLSVQPPDDPISQLFHAATLIREYRGDCHNSLLSVNQINGCEAHILMVAIGAEQRSTAQTSRGYTDAEWTHGIENLTHRGLIAKDETITPEGRSFRSDLERRTNLLMAPLFDVASDGELTELQALAAPIEMAIHDSGSLPTFQRVHELLASS